MHFMASVAYLSLGLRDLRRLESEFQDCCHRCPTSWPNALLFRQRVLGSATKVE